MIEVTQAFQNAWLNGNQKYIQLNFSDNTTLDDNSIVSESFSMKQALCEESQLMFGLTSSTEVSIQILNNNKQYKGLNMNILMGAVDDENHYYTMDLGTYKIENDVRSDNRLYRTLTAYDKLYDVLNSDYSDWYGTLSNTFTVKSFRDAFFQHVGITQNTYTLIQDNVTLNKRDDVTNLSGREILQGIMETSACFGFIDYDGHFQYVTPSVGHGKFPADDLYPSNDIYPSDIADIMISNTDDDAAPVEVIYADYSTQKITGAAFNSTGNTEEASAGQTGNVYEFSDNVLFFDLDVSVLEGIASRFINETKELFYMPSKIKTRARVWAQLGDMLCVVSGEQTVITPILSRTMNGITALYDTYQADGTEYFIYSSNATKKQLVEIERRIAGIAPASEILAQAQANAATLINNSTKGFVSLVDTNNDGHIDELYIANDVDYTRANKYWKWSSGGLGYTNNGGQSFEVAMTMDGSIVANRITSGTLNCDQVTVQTGGSTGMKLKLEDGGISGYYDNTKVMSINTLPASQGYEGINIMASSAIWLNTNEIFVKQGTSSSSTVNYGNSDTRDFYVLDADKITGKNQNVMTNIATHFAAISTHFEGTINGSYYGYIEVRNVNSSGNGYTTQRVPQYGQGIDRNGNYPGDYIYLSGFTADSGYVIMPATTKLQYLECNEKMYPGESYEMQYLAMAKRQMNYNKGIKMHSYYDDAMIDS